MAKVLLTGERGRSLDTARNILVLAYRSIISSIESGFSGGIGSFLTALSPPNSPNRKSRLFELDE
jgi:hypothetical protein